MMVEVVEVIDALVAAMICPHHTNGCRIALTLKTPRMGV